MVDLAAAQSGLGHEVDVFLLAGVRGARGEALRAELDVAKVRCFGATPRNPRAPLNAVRLLRRIVVGRYDVVHAHLFSIELLLASLIPLLSALQARPLLVRTLHSSNIYGTRSRVLALLLARSFDWNFACGQKVLDNYANLFGQSRASVIENGVRTASHTIDKTARTIREELGLAADAFVVVCVGAFRGESLASSAKAQDVALRAFRLAFGDAASAHLLFAGEGELRTEAEALARELGAKGNVHFLGSLADIQPLLKDADLLFMPSRYEGLPMVGLEAGCAGVPVLASSIEELLNVGSPYGWIFSRDNSVEDFARQLGELQEDRAAIRIKAQEMSALFRERYSIERCARDYLAEIQRLLGWQRRPSRQMSRHEYGNSDA